MTSDEVRKKYFAFFEKRGHVRISSASLVPEHDSTTLFTGSGMQPLVPYLLGERHPQGNRLVNSQKCFRAEDIEEVGDNRHTTFFEMLGNWSLGDYFKEEQLQWFFEFLTKELALPQERLWVTCFDGDEKFDLPRDTESAEIWKKLGISEERIRFYGSEKNWWSRSGVPENMPAGEPGGPDSEVFFEFTEIEHDPAYGKTCHPNCDCGRFVEIGNSVFMQYLKRPDGRFDELPQKNVDFGGGLERLTAAANNDADVFKIDIFKLLINKIELLSTSSMARYRIAGSIQKSFRIVCDHLRAAVFLAGDGVTPSNTEQGYILRRLLRRTIRRLDALSVPENSLQLLIEIICDQYKNSYPDLQYKKMKISEIFASEENTFRKTLSQGLIKFNRLTLKSKIISGKDAFILFTTYGFPLELTQELAEEKGVSVDVEGFKTEMEGHKQISRKSAEKKFKGGLADTSEMSVKYHTATHLLHQALRDVLGNHVFQKGSNITGERLRFDFSHDAKMTEKEKSGVEELVNKKIQEGLPVVHEDISLEEAEKRGAIGLFEEKYGDKVRVYKIGDFSLEFCGGPHVQNTKELGSFKIKKEEAVARGIRRIKAVLE